MTPLEVLTRHTAKTAGLQWHCLCGVSWDDYSGTHAQHQWRALEAEVPHV